MPRKSIIYGEATTEHGGLPMTIEPPISRGGLTPEVLDPIVRTLANNADAGSKLLETYSPILEGLMHQLQEKLVEFYSVREVVEGEPPKAEPDLLATLQLADKVSVIIARISKLVMKAAAGFQGRPEDQP